MGAERMAARGRAARAGWVVVDALVLLYALVPVLWILSLSLKPTSTVKDGKLIPSQVTFDNYRGIFRGDFFSSALVNSVGIGVITTVIAVVIGAMAAYAVARLEFPGKRAVDRGGAADFDVPADLAGHAAVQHRTPDRAVRHLARADHAVHHVRAAAGDLYAVGVLPGDPVGSGEGGQDGRCHTGPGFPQGDRAAGGAGHRDRPRSWCSSSPGTTSCWRCR